MGRGAVIVLYVVVMVALIVGVDMAFLRERFWARLLFNVGVVLVSGLLYVWVRRR